MPLIQVPFKPGIDKQLTETGAQGRWIDSDNVRFRYGLPEKIGGWTKVVTNALIGAPRAQQPFSSLDSENFDFVATNKKQYIYQKTDNSINDVSPQRYGAYGTTGAAESLTSAFDTNATTTVTVNWTAHGAGVGDFVTFASVTAPTGVGYVDADFEKEFEIQTVDTNTFTITMATAAS